MTRVFFFHDATDKLAHICELVRQAWDARQPVLLYAPEPRAAQTVDRLLWTRPSTSFVPHCHASSPLAAATPIVLTDDLQAPPQTVRLINMGEQPAPDFAKFQTLVEVVGLTDADRGAARQRAKAYKAAGCELNFIDLQGDAATAQGVQWL